MAAKFLILLAVSAAASALPVLQYAEEAPAHYQFQYSVHDEHTGDLKQQEEARAGDAVHGSYSLVQPDGVRRVVHYTADKEHGFNAEVVYEGHPTPAPAKIAYAAPVAKLAYAAPVAKLAYSAPVANVAYSAPVAKIAYSAPVAKIAYSAPVAKIAYSAPVAKLAYTAPVAKVAYAQPLTHVSFASPAISYHH